MASSRPSRPPPATPSRDRPRTAPVTDPDSSSSLADVWTPSPIEHLSLQPLGQPPSFTFVCLGVGGGPLESDCSCYLLKPGDRRWEDGSVVVEGGSWLGALSRVLEDVGPNSAFGDVEFPYAHPDLRAGYIGTHAKGFLITHAHLDHILGMILGSASLPGKRSVYGLRPTLENVLEVFNGKIWPKLASWKEDEPHTMYHMRSVESQVNTALDDSFSILPFSLSHGLNPSVPPAPPTPTPPPNSSLSKPGRSSSGYFSKRYSLPPAHIGMDWSRGPIGGMPGMASTSAASERPTFRSPFAPDRIAQDRLVEESGSEAGSSVASPVIPSDKQDGPLPRISPEAVGEDEDAVQPLRGSRLGSLPSGGPRLPPPRGVKAPARQRRPRTALGSETAPDNASAQRRISIDRSPPALDSTAFFITNRRTKQDVLFFGDVEPDAISRSPRNRRVWQHAASKYLMGQLHCVFLECSFPGAHPTEFLYGHLSVTHLMDELRVLARIVVCEKRRREALRRPSAPDYASRGEVPPFSPGPSTEPSSLREEELKGSLVGLTVVVIHVKTALFPAYEDKQAADPSETDRPGLVDPRTMRERVLQELREAEEGSGLGVRFELAQQGRRIEC